jgi:hydrogenase expression/formation protein HypD
MQLSEAFRSREITAPLVAEITRILVRPVRIMEVCGTHTMAIFRHGIRSLLPEQITLLSGPGCPVCVTPAGHIDAFLAAARLPQVVIATFGDLVRVPGSEGASLASARSAGARVEIVYSPMDALALAQREPERTVVFAAIGFETTAPTIAATLMQARRLGVGNFLIIAAIKTMPAALDALLDDPDLRVDGLLCPGHVSAIIGSEAYRPLAEKYGLACAVAGFEPADILAGLLSLVRQIQAGRPGVDNCYTRAVRAEGNARARALMEEVFTPADSEWRGLGTIPASGLVLREQYQDFDGMQPWASRCGRPASLRGAVAARSSRATWYRRTALSTARPVRPCSRWVPVWFPMKELALPFFATPVRKRAAPAVTELTLEPSPAYLMKADLTISLDHGSGGLASQNLISGLFLKYLTCPQLRDLEDCAVLGEYAGRIAFSTDSFVVDPLFFPGGDIGELAVHGTINDLAMRGARPIALSLALIIEEGFLFADLERVIASVARCCEAAGVAIVTGDTKVVPRGKADGLFINTTGIGIVSHRHDIQGKELCPGMRSFSPAPWPITALPS